MDLPSVPVWTDAFCCMVVISSGQARDEHYPKNPRQPTTTVDVDELFPPECYTESHPIGAEWKMGSVKQPWQLQGSPVAKSEGR